jgi:hypothetical protein
MGRLVVDGRVILKWILSQRDVRVWSGFMWPSRGSSGGPTEIDRRIWV